MNLSAAHYDSKYSGTRLVAPEYFPAQFDFCMRLAGRRNPKTILDVGGGAGAYSLILQKMGLTPTMLEYSRVGAEKAASDGVRRVIQGDFFADPLAGEQFDVVLARGFSGFNTDDLDAFARVLARAEGYAAPGGVTVFWSWTDLSRRWSPSGAFNPHPADLAPFFDLVVAVPLFRVLAYLPLAATFAANALLKSIPGRIPATVSLIGVRRRR